MSIALILIEFDIRIGIQYQCNQIPLFQPNHSININNSIMQVNEREREIENKLCAHIRWLEVVASIHNMCYKVWSFFAAQHFNIFPKHQN